MSKQLQERAKRFLMYWERRGALPMMQESWAARVIARYARGGTTFSSSPPIRQMLAERIELIERDPPEEHVVGSIVCSAFHVGYYCKSEDAPVYRQELMELLNAILQEVNELEG